MNLIDEFIFPFSTDDVPVDRANPNARMERLLADGVGENGFRERGEKRLESLRISELRRAYPKLEEEEENSTEASEQGKTENDDEDEEQKKNERADVQRRSSYERQSRPRRRSR